MLSTNWPSSRNMRYVTTYIPEIRYIRPVSCCVLWKRRTRQKPKRHLAESVAQTVWRRLWRRPCNPRLPSAHQGSWRTQRWQCYPSPKNVLLRRAIQFQGRKNHRRNDGLICREHLDLTQTLAPSRFHGARPKNMSGHLRWSRQNWGPNSSSLFTFCIRVSKCYNGW